MLLYFRRKKKATFDTASKISEPRLGEQYRAIADYTKEDKWDLNLKAGTEVEVIEKTESGRYLIKEVMQVMKVTESDVCSGVIHNYRERCTEYSTWYMSQSTCNIRNMLVA